MPILLLTLVLLQAAPVANQVPIHGSTREVIMLAPGIHQVLWTTAPGFPAIGSSLVIVNDRDVVVVDTGFTRRSAAALIEEIRKLTPHPVSLVVNTHWHDDHMAGNELFVETFSGVEIVGHPETRRGVVEFTEPYIAKTLPEVTRRLDELRKSSLTDATRKELETLEWRLEAMSARPVAATLEVTDTLLIQRGPRRIEVRHLGAANTKGDLVVYLPAERIVASGDMAITPIQFAFFSSPSAWSETLEKLATIGADVWVPGHGPAQRDPVFIRDLQSMLRALVTQVKEGVAAGRTLDELKKSVTIERRAGSVYEKIGQRTFDALFRLPAIESAYAEIAVKK